MLFDSKDAASKYRTEALGWDGGSELGRQELGKDHSTAVGQMVFKVFYEKDAQCHHSWGCPPQLLSRHSS